MQETDNLKLPYLMAAQAQKHVTHNEALRALDAIIHLSIADRNLTAPPASPQAGTRYLIAAGATGDWAGKDGEIAAYQDDAWMFYAPQAGWLAWISDEDVALIFDGTTWLSLGSGGGGGITSVNPISFVGVNATADTTNRLSVSSPATLFNHEGNGHQLKLNKAAPADTASLLYQTGFSGRAELGLTGDDDFHFKVSDDGTTWNDAIVIDRTNGAVTFPNTTLSGGGGGAGFRRSLLINGDFGINQRVFAGGSLSSGVYGYDRWKASGGAAVVSRSATTGVITFTSGTLEQIIELLAAGVAGLDVTLSVWDLTGGNLDYDVAGITGTVTAGSGQRSATISVPGGATGNLSVKFSPNSGAVTFDRVKLEVGSTATPFEYRPLAEELLNCQRYFCKSFPLTQVPGITNATDNVYAGFDWNTSYIGTQAIMYPAEMRSVPTLTFYPNHDLGASIGEWAALASGYQTAPVSVTAWLSNRQFLANLFLPGHGLNGRGTFARGHYTAEAEL
ncbi:MAG: DUF2793 domain-containing protein [Filomicrobium sp.]